MATKKGKKGPSQMVIDLQQKAAELSDAGYHEEAIKAWAELTELCPANLHFLYERGRCQLERSHLPEAIADLREAQRRRYKTAELYVNLCRALNELECVYEAHATAEKGVKLFPDTASLYQYIGEVHMKHDLFDEARAVFEKGLSLDPTSELYKELLEKLDRKIKRANGEPKAVVEAIPGTTKIINPRHEHENFREEWREMQRQSSMRKPDGQITMRDYMDRKESNRVIAKMEKTADALRENFNRLRNEKKKSEAAEQLYDFLDKLGQAYIEASEYKKAEKVFRSFPRSTHGLQRSSGLGRIFMEIGKFHKAEKIISDALKKYPFDPYLLSAFGMIQDAKGEPYEALRYIDLSLAYCDAGDVSSTLFGKASALHTLAYYDEEFKVLSELLERDNYNPMYLVAMGDCCLKRNLPWEAMSHYREADCFSSAFYDGLFKSYYLAGLMHEAYMLAREGVLTINNDLHLYENFALSALEIGQFEHAETAISEGLKIDSEYEPLKDMERELRRILGTKKFIEKPMNELLSSGQSDEAAQDKLFDYLCELEEEHPEYFLIGNTRRRPRQQKGKGGHNSGDN